MVLERKRLNFRARVLALVSEKYVQLYATMSLCSCAHTIISPLKKHNEVLCDFLMVEMMGVEPMSTYPSNTLLHNYLVFV